MRIRNLYYGWYIVVGVVVASLGAGTMEPFGFSAFVGPMSTDLGWSKGFVNSGISARLLAGALFGMMLGPIIDRQGVRSIMRVAGTVGIVCALLMTRVAQPWQFLALFAVSGIMVAGAGEHVVGILIPKWFVRKRGRALAIGTTGDVLVGVFITPLLAASIALFGWQSGWWIVAAIMFCTVVPASFILRRQPEDMGLRPDGLPLCISASSSGSHTRTVTESENAEPVWTPSMAVRTPAFWLMLLGFNLSGLATTGVVVLEVDYLTGRGLAPVLAGLVLSVHAFSGICGRFLWGYLVDKWSVQLCLAFIYMGAALATIILLQTSALWTALLFASLYGLNIGGSPVLTATAWSNYYGRHFLGSIRGIAFPFQVISRAIGPVMAGLLFDLTGNYTLPLAVFVVTLAMGSVLFFKLKPPSLTRPVTS